ncbi:hypothetical protein E2C01_014910 [Portunus trituberculatus]|uniref:Uncharacterized protein n=1 Tax=Portunus trituberculatus TaxID=210409 RepID=A0A5B7DLB0_PORTR|nr:hypothetical protein [Portunus trituberculatus]
MYDTSHVTVTLVMKRSRVSSLSSPFTIKHGGYVVVVVGTEVILKETPRAYSTVLKKKKVKPMGGAYEVVGGAAYDRNLHPRRRRRDFTKVKPGRYWSAAAPTPKTLPIAH